MHIHRITCFLRLICIFSKVILLFTMKFIFKGMGDIMKFKLFRIIWICPWLKI